MANDDRILLRKTDGSGAGIIFKTQKEAKKFMELNDGYAEESTEVADTKAVKPAEDKAVNQAQNKSRG